MEGGMRNKNQITALKLLDGLNRKRETFLLKMCILMDKEIGE
jgi:hypothetical protein